MYKRIVAFLAVAMCLINSAAMDRDSIASGKKHTPEWHIGVEALPAYVPGTCSFLRGVNYKNTRVSSSFSASVRTDFSFNPSTRLGRLYRGAYQGIGLGVNSFKSGVLGTPVSVYIYQGMPFVRWEEGRLSLGYEWQFGAAFGWKHSDNGMMAENMAMSTSVTAHMGIGLKLRYKISGNLTLLAGIEARHFSNGNTSLPNSGVNTIGASVGMAYTLNPVAGILESVLKDDIADKGEWMYDIMAYGAWRRRALVVDDSPALCPGKFGVAGLQIAPLRRFNRWFAAGGALDLKYDESAGLLPYWVEGTSGENIKFHRPPFGKQFSAGIAAQAELTMPIFSLNAGVGYDFVCPKGDKRFYQSLTLKTFVTQNLYLNVGYRLGRFRQPQNLMLGVGVRLK